MNCHINTWLTDTGLAPLNSSLTHILENNPSAQAYAEEDYRLSYAQLVSIAGGCAVNLRAAGLTEGDRIALDAPRSRELFIIIVSCLISGISFISVPRTYGTEQKKQFAEDTYCAAIYSLSEIFSDADIKIKDLGNLSLLESASKRRIHNQMSGREVYCVRTSGTTGNPKVVPIHMSQISGFFEDVLSGFDISSGRRWLWVHDLSFDLSIWEVVGCLVYGGCLVVLKEEEKRDPKRIWNTLEQYRINQIILTPSEFRFIFKESKVPYLSQLSLEEILFCGEKLSVETIREFYQELKSNNVNLVNTYGPSEATIFCSSHVVKDKDIHDGSIPIGKPFPNMDFSLVNMENEINGELILTGKQVFDGYDRQPLSTHEYLTGDICRKGENGEYYYVGRKGGFHKVNGYRIDLLEIEEFLQSIPGVGEATSWVEENRENGSILIAAINVMDGYQISTRELRKHCSHLSPWLRPARYLTVLQSDWPMNIRGKTDKEELKRRFHEK